MTAQVKGFGSRPIAAVGAHAEGPASVRAFAAFIGRSPDTATAEDLRRFQHHQAQTGVRPPSINSAVAALRFFFTVTLDRPTLRAGSPSCANRAGCRPCRGPASARRLRRASRASQAQEVVRLGQAALLRTGSGACLSRPLHGRRRPGLFRISAGARGRRRAGGARRAGVVDAVGRLDVGSVKLQARVGMATGVVSSVGRLSSTMSRARRPI